MRIVFKPAGTLVLLSVIAVLCFFAFNNVEGMMGQKRAVAETPTPGAMKRASTVIFRPVDLSRMGAVDWAYYGVAPSEGTDISQKVMHKAKVTRRINPLQFIGHPPKTYEGDPRVFRWQDGDGFATMPEVRAGLETDGISNGFRFTVTPELGRRHILRVWVGGSQVRSKLMARLSDGSALSQVDESFSSVGDKEFRSLYTIIFEAKKPGQELIVSYLVADSGTTGSVSLQAVALE